MTARTLAILVVVAAVLGIAAATWLFGVIATV